MRFTKMNGAGNDFILLDAIVEPFDESAAPALARALCDRRRSIGADGLMLVTRAEGDADYRMRFYNSDGSLTLYAHCLLDGNALGQQRFTCHIREREVNGDDIERFEGAFEIAPNTPLTYAETHGEYLTELARITDVYVSKSALATYVSASGRLYANLSDEQLEQWENSTVDFSTSESYSTIIEGNMRMLDENGEAPGSIDGERCFRMEFVMEASEARPEQLYVKLYNLDTNEYGKTVVIPLTPVESEEQ